MLQQDVADDFVIATGKQISVREFVRLSAKELGVELEFTGEGLDETATVKAFAEFSGTIGSIAYHSILGML